MGIFANWFGNNFGTSLLATGGSRLDAIQGSNPFDLSMVVACRSLVANVVSTFPLQAVDQATGEPLDRQPPITRRPNPSEPLGDTLEKVINNMTGPAGQCVLRITARGMDDRPIALEQLNPSRVTWILTADGQDFSQFFIDGIPAEPGSLLVIPMILDGTTPVGKSPLALINSELLTLNAAMIFGDEWLRSAATPLYSLVSPTRLQEGQADELIEAWTSAREAHRPAVLSGSFSLETYDQITPSDAMLLDVLNAYEAAVARVMQVPPSLVNAVAQASLTYSNQRDELARFLTLTLDTQYLHRVEAAWSELLPRGQVARFDTSQLTRLNETERLNNAIKGVAGGLLGIDEARKMIGLEAATEPLREIQDVDTRIV